MLTLRYLSSIIIITLLTLSPSTTTLPSPKPQIQPTTLHPRKEISHNLFCDPALPSAELWPANAPAPRTSYPNLVSLCGYDRSRPSVGCLCDTPYVQVKCGRELAHPTLYAAFLPDCAHDCYCEHARINHFDTSVSAVESGGHWFQEPWPAGAAQLGQAAQRAGGRAHID